MDDLVEGSLEARSRDQIHQILHRARPTPLRSRRPCRVLLCDGARQVSRERRVLDAKVRERPENVRRRL